MLPSWQHPGQKRPAFAVSAVGDGMSAVGVAWLAIRIAPPAARRPVVRDESARHRLTSENAGVLSPGRAR
jgi:hypothetical protein